MNISKSTWDKYTHEQELIRTRAAETMQKWIDANGIGDRNAMISFASKLATMYGEAAGTAACEMYDAIANAVKADTMAALPANTANYHEVAKSINGSLKQSPDGRKVAAVVERLVKQVAADTTIQNAARDGAEFAWIPDGGACAFCVTISSRGWQTASQKLIENHAEHIHANCNCEFAIRFDKKSNVNGYDPEALKKQYDEAEGKNSKDKINSLRREFYQENKDYINEQKRELYAENVEAEELND